MSKLIFTTKCLKLQVMEAMMVKTTNWDLIEKLAQELGVTKHATAKWRQRNTVPHKWRLPIVLKSGGLIRWDDYRRMDRVGSRSVGRTTLN